MPSRALLSVSDKAGIVAFARSLADLGVELLSTGGTRQTLAEAGIDSTELSDHMGFPEIMDGRVKTLHPKVHGGILARGEVDAGALREHGIAPIDLVAVNLYPFARAAAAGVTAQEALAHIDIGGPTLLRGAAKNHARVAAVAHPGDYGDVIDALRAGGFTAAQRFELAAKAFAHTARYDAAIAAWFAGVQNAGAADASPFPPTLSLSFAKRGVMRYGQSVRRGSHLSPSAASSRSIARWTAIRCRRCSAPSSSRPWNLSHGAKIVAAGAGFLLNNEMDDFSAMPDAPNAYGLIGGAVNAIAPGKRMLSSMSPTIVLRDGEPLLVTGSPGGSTIITTVLQVIVNVIDHGMDLSEAVSAPRFHHQWQPDRIVVERFGLSPDTRARLEAMGHRNIVTVSWGRGIGDANSVMRVDGGFVGMADPRGAGAAKGV